MTTDPMLAGPTLKTITVRLSAETAHQNTEARQELVLYALAAALVAVSDSLSLAWTVRAIPGGEPLLYDLTPLPGHPVSVDAAWEMTDALREQPQVDAAEPSFVLARGASPGAAPHTPE
ncbi:MAG: hypothetical protein ACJ8CR_12965 [Roseiflexaceae bacterium]